jgi:hypothetical protein
MMDARSHSNHSLADQYPVTGNLNRNGAVLNAPIAKLAGYIISPRNHFSVRAKGKTVIPSRGHSDNGLA